MSGRSAFPPMRVHQAKRIPVQDAQPIIATYIERSKKNPHLHPDSWLATNGIRFGHVGGLHGGWAIHHLKRIEAGMRGESLMPESNEELVARFGEEEAAMRVGSVTKPLADADVGDAVENGHAGESGPVDKAARKAAKQARRAAEKKEGSHRKRQKKHDDIDTWATDSAAAGASDAD